MIVLKKFDDIYEVIRERKNIQVDLQNLEDIDYLRVIDLIRSVRNKVTRISRCKYSFNYE